MTEGNIALLSDISDTIIELTNFNEYHFLTVTNEEFRRKTSYAAKQKNTLFVGFCKQCTSPMLCKNIFSAKRVMKLSAARF